MSLGHIQPLIHAVDRSQEPIDLLDVHVHFHKKYADIIYMRITKDR